MATQPLGTEMRKTGIGLVGDVPWGTHFFMFYETKEDLLDTLIPYFKAGLESGELCFWAVSEPLTVEEATNALRNATPEFDRHLADHSIEIVSGRQFYLTGNDPDLERVMRTWAEKTDSALARGYAGLRVSGSIAWRERKYWNAFSDYENELNNFVSSWRMTVLCTYPMAGSTAAEVLDVARTHQFAIARRNRVWEMVETSELKQAKSEIKRLNDELERRVIDRTRQLEAVNQALRKEVLERERAEKAVRESEDHLQLVVDTTPAMLHSARPDGYLDFFNKRWLEYLGVSLVDLLGWRWTSVIHPDDLAQLVDRWQTSLATGKPFEAEARLRRADGEYRLALHRKVPLRDETGNIVKWHGSVIDIEDRRRAEEEVKSSEQRYRVVVEAASDAVISMDESGGILLANPATARIFGYDPVELIGKPLTVLMPEFMRKLHEAGFRRYLTTGERHLNWQGAEVTALRKNGQEFPVEVSFGEMISNGHKAFTGFIRDISEKKRAEDELRRQKEVFQKIFENIPVMVFFRGQDRRVDMVNPEWERAMGWTLKEISGQNLDIYTLFFPDPDYRQMVLDLAAASTGEWNDLKVSVKDGRVIDVASTFVRLSDGSTLGIGRDVTEQKRAEAELRESQARFRLVSDSAPVMIWMSGTDKLCTYFNRPWLDFTGRSIERELGKGWAEGVDPEDLQRCLDTYIQSFDRREAFKMEYRLRRHDGEFRWVLDIGVPRFNPDGFFAGYIGSCIDVTEQKRSDEQLRQAQEDLARVTRVVAMGELAAAIAHEVNQPLTAIVTNANFCLRQLDGATSKPDELQAAITAIASDGTRASGVISRIRSLLKKGAPDRTELDINEIIQDVTTLLRHEFTRSRVSLRTELASDLPRVPGDPVQLQQVLINLIMNAIEATSSSTNGRRTILIRSAKNPDGVVVQVQDSGPGIAPDLADRIFEPFFTTKAEGIGMGLSITHSIIESHGGHLGIVPSPTGALFEFTLPTD